MAIARTLDPVAIRADFPQFERDFDGRRLAYLDSASTSLKPRVVVQAVDQEGTAPDIEAQLQDIVDSVAIEPASTPAASPSPSPAA